MKRIGLVITRMLLGGASKVVHSIIKSGASRYSFTLFTGPEDLNSSEIDSLKSTCEIIIIPPLLRAISPYNDLKTYFQLKKHLSSYKYDIIHTHTSKAGFLGRIAAFDADVEKIIHTTHGTIYMPENRIAGVPKDGLGKWLLRQAEVFAGKKTDSMTVLSRDEKEICIRLGLSTERNTFIIPNGIDLNHFFISIEEKGNLRKMLGLRKEEIVIVATSRLSSEKGHEVLIDAFKTAYHKNKFLKLFIVGDGPEESKLKTQAGELTNNGAIIFTGSTKDVRKYLGISDIFIMPSHYEGFGLSALEAMAAGLPVIASDVGGVPEMISNDFDGIIVPPGQRMVLAEKISLLSSSADMRIMLGENAKLKANEYSLDKMLNSYYELYDK